MPPAAQAILPYDTASVTGIPVPVVSYGRALCGRCQEGALIFRSPLVRLFLCLMAGQGPGAADTDHGG